MNHQHAQPTDQDISTRVHRALHTAPISADTRQHIWEDLMQSTAAPLPGIASTSATTPTTAAGTPRGGSFTESRLARGGARWQATVSLAVVVAVLVGLMGIAWQRGILDGPPPTPAGQFPALAQQGTPFAPTECVAHGPLRHTATELEAMDLTYWTLPEYTAARIATPEEGQAVVNAFVGWQQCLASNGPSDFLTSYYSDRWQYIELAPTFADSRTEEIQTFNSRVNPSEEIALHMPLPIGVPQVFEFDGSRFLPQQVYQLTDGRFAVLFSLYGETFTLEDSTGTTSSNHDVTFQFLAFMEIDGVMYLDEIELLCASSMLNAVTNTPIARGSLDCA